ncbi:TonB-dependent siderophore receptor [Flavobacterium psychrophilum]|uniref:TonB-dependent siderophore receptor n=1 Tax=Flavobacterium psychrophilum TaxID=96345 RepID=UPI0004F9095D|nr:TonB-dependent siderophore receptor [Flavobacterium psychrophilum]AIN74321.1 TonB-dependent receptor [Flavobacterium psychrophilum FPG3]EKT2069941.1 TonB-dependent siderophore receptor [Flavobacterium psychrophilum]MBF2045021.1 TonB-dependent siderophore receptor [Flavobacterium psychrophilum]OXB05551.1 TonB-dependent siderophore receptor [Flavobacterium psychrophilum DSM 3660 = ATCC 49418]SCY35217.1 iron complex outermembrane recepter protein [Flavobacterium psychrophilum DSM 3660] [Flavob
MCKYILFPSVALLLCATSFAQKSTLSEAENEYSENRTMVNDTVKNKKRQILDEVTIISNQQKTPISATRSGIKAIDLPQSIQVVGSETIAQQQSIRLSDVIKNANGIYISSARGGAQESLYSRGYDMSTNNMFKNGFRFSSGSIPEVSSLEKVEILKGSAALLYGNVAPGGILNMVTKSPSFTKGGELAMQMGSYSFYKPSLDIYGPLSNAIAYRLTGSYENSKSFRDIVKKERYYINPSFLFKVSPKTEITLQGDYLHDDWTPDFGTGIVGKTIANLPRNTYLGANWSTGQTKQVSLSALVNHNFNTNWKLNFNTSFQDYSRTSKGTERVQPSDAIATYGNLKRNLGQNQNVEQITGQQLSLQGNFNTGSVKHQLFTGIDFENSVVESNTFVFKKTNNPFILQDGIYDLVNIFTFDSNSQTNLIPNAIKTKRIETETNRFGVYAQDLVSITEKIKLLAGLRWSWQEAEVNTYDLLVNTSVMTPKRKDEAFSPKVGLVFQPTKNTSLFVSYANSFTPNSGTTADLVAIKPSIIDQYEVGIKKYFWKNVLSTNITLYQITNSNLAQTAEFKANGSINTDSSIKVLSGETKSKGIEVDITARPFEGFNIIAGYSYNDMRYTKTSGLNGSFIQGDRLVRTPKNTANLSFFYTLPTGLLKGLSFGALGNYVGNRFGGWNNQVVISSTGAVSINDRAIPLTDYKTVDLSAGYTWGQFSILCKLANVANELNYTVHENYSVNPIAPRQVIATIKYKF